jgi:hypothetical protein
VHVYIRVPVQLRTFIRAFHSPTYWMSSEPRVVVAVSFYGQSRLLCRVESPLHRSGTTSTVTTATSYANRGRCTRYGCIISYGADTGVRCRLPKLTSTGIRTVDCCSPLYVTLASARHTKHLTVASPMRTANHAARHHLRRALQLTPTLCLTRC